MSTVSVGSSFAALSGLALAVITQPYGSLIFDPHDFSYFWRMFPAVALAEAVVILYVSIRYGRIGIRPMALAREMSVEKRRAARSLSVLPVVFLFVKAVGTTGSSATTVIAVLYMVPWTAVQILFVFGGHETTCLVEKWKLDELAEMIKVKYRLRQGQVAEVIGKILALVYWAVGYASAWMSLLCYVAFVSGLFMTRDFELITWLLDSLGRRWVIPMWICGYVFIGVHEDGKNENISERIDRLSLAFFLLCPDFISVVSTVGGAVWFIKSYNEEDTGKAGWLEWLPG